MPKKKPVNPLQSPAERLAAVAELLPWESCDWLPETTPLERERKLDFRGL